MFIVSLLVLSTEDVGSIKSCSSNLSGGRADDCELRSKRVRFVGGAELTSIFGEFVLSALTPGGKGPVAGADLFPKNAVNFDLRDI